MATQLEDLTDDEPQDDGSEAHEPVHDDAAADGDQGDASGDDAGDDEDLITFGADGVVRGEDESEGVRSLRNRLKEVEREKRDLEARVAPKVEDIGPKPDLDDYWERPDEYERDLLDWNEKKRKADETVAEAEKLNQSVTEEVEAGRQAFAEQRASLKVKGFDAADDTVSSTLADGFLNAINIAAGPKAAALRFYLGTHPDELAKLKVLDPRKVTDLIKCSSLAGAMAEKLTVTRRKPETQPERVHAGGSGTTGGRPDMKLERLEREADATGNRTALIAYRRELKTRSN